MTTLSDSTGTPRRGPPSVDEFRAEVRSWLHTRQHPDLGRYSMDDPRTWARRVAWERELAQQCWVGLDWPAEYGGLGASLLHQLVFEEEYAAARAPARAGFFGEHLLGPTLLVHGTESQKRRFLPRIAAGEEFWCQGYSEPGAGSDLAGVSTRAVRDGGEWVISGQKIWTSLAQFADWIFVLCRTDPDAPRHRGLSLLLCPLHQPSVEVRPIRQLTGDREFNEVFFDGARTAADMVVGAPGDGWRVATTVLGFERGIAFLGMQRGFEREFAAVAALAGEDAHPSASIRHRVVDAWVGLQVMRAIGLRTVSAYAAGQAPGPEASIGKLYWSHWHQRLGSLAMDVGGMSSTTVDGPEELARLQRMFLFSRQDTIAAGSSEIQRTIIGERVLGLPREPT